MNQAKEKKVKSHAVDLLWTGGWDSTFRLLDLVIHLKKNVRPHYIVCSTRRTLKVELKTMVEIMTKIQEDHPESANLVQPVHLSLKYNIPEDLSITKKYENLSARVHFGPQYEYLARYAKYHPSVKLEIGLQHKNFADRFDLFTRGRVRLNSNDPDYQFWELVDVDPEEDVSILTPFRFPIWRTPKLQMKAVAEEYGFLDILEMSWTCQRPMKGKPCGICTPCVVALREGMQYRFPRSAVLRNKIMYDPLPREIRYFLQYIHRALKKMFNHASSQSNDKKETPNESS